MSEYSVGFSIFMIVLEIVLGLMLMIGYKPKLTAWLFAAIVVFFTLLTGFTYLTGFVPTEANFFDFAKWGAYSKTQMRVTDCGCFGDFIKLDPKISFFKDLGLLIPTVLFLLKTSNMHTLWSEKSRLYATLATTLFSLGLCIQNTYLNLPVIDFRPFKIGTDVKTKRAKEEEARSNIEILGWKLENTQTGEKATFMEPIPGKITYYKQYPKDKGWKVKDQIKEEPYILVDSVKTPYPSTKLSEFAIEDPENGEVTEDLLNEEGYSIMVVAYKLYGETVQVSYNIQDTTWVTDTVRVNRDSVSLQPRFTKVTTRQVSKELFRPSDNYKNTFMQAINPLLQAAAEANWKVYTIVTYQDAEKIGDFKKAIDAAYPFYKGDDKLLKTIIRGNPGIVIWKNGAVVDMYHHRHIPTFQALQKKFK
jgi:hypothetical protein